LLILCSHRNDQGIHIMNRFQDKVVVITGGNGGIGMEVSRAFSSEGARVVLFAKDEQAAIDAAASELGSGAWGAPTDTETMAMPFPVPEEMKQEAIDAVPMKRLARLDEIAKAILFLASSDASFITGTELAVDGGTTQL